MNPLEQLAKELFEEFSFRETGRIASWSYLSKPRKIEWMKEILHVHEYLSSKLIEQVKPVPNLSSVNTTWAQGFNEGVRSERIQFITLVANIHQELLDELDQFQERKS